MEEQLRGQAAASSSAGDIDGEMHWNLQLSMFFRAQGKLNEAIEINKFILDNVKDKNSAIAHSALLSTATVYGEFGRLEEALKLKEGLLENSSCMDSRFQGEQYFAVCCHCEYQVV